MSKSYDNAIPLFADEKRLRKLIMKIKTNSLEPGEPKDTADSTLFQIFQAFATVDDVKEIEKRYADGIAWGEMKQLLFEYLNEHLKPARAEYQRLMDDPAEVERALIKGAERPMIVAGGGALWFFTEKALGKFIKVPKAMGDANTVEKCID